MTTLLAEVSLRQVLALCDTNETNVPQTLKTLPTCTRLQGPLGPEPPPPVFAVRPEASPTKLSPAGPAAGGSA